MSQYIKTALVCALTLAVIARVPAIKTIVLGA